MITVPNDTQCIDQVKRKYSKAVFGTDNEFTRFVTDEVITGMTIEVKHFGVYNVIVNKVDNTPLGYAILGNVIITE